MVHKKLIAMYQNGIFLKMLLIAWVCPVNSQYYFRHQRYPFVPTMPMMPQPRQVRQTPYYLNVNSQRYLAVPGRVVQHYNTAPLQYTVPVRNVNAPIRNVNIPLRNLNVPLRNVNVPLFSPTPYLQSYYQLEADPGSSNPDQEEQNGGGLEPPPPESGPEQPPPPESEPEQPPPPEAEPEQTPPMMMMMTTEQPPPPPPPENDNDDGNDDEDEEDDPPPPPPSHGKGKLVHKHISVHVPPDDMESDNEQTTVIRPKIAGPQKHLNIIFIKAPSKSNRKKTEVILPDTPEQKTLVYVLVKKPDPANDGSIKVRGPAPTKPPKPQVYFIRYKQKKKHNHHHYHHH